MRLAILLSTFMSIIIILRNGINMDNFWKNQYIYLFASCLYLMTILP